MCRRSFVLLPAAAAICGMAAARPAAKPPKITIGKDTTCITEPLAPDGMPDYLAAINARHGRGVTKDNNALLPLLQAFGHDLLPEETREQLLAALDHPPAGLEPFLRLPAKWTEAGKQFEQALKRPWTPKDHPELAKWMKTYARPLEEVAAAGKRSRFYVPAVAAEPKKDSPPCLRVMLPLYARVREGAQALVVRAHLAVGEGRGDDAVADLAAVYRLGAVIGQDYTLVGRLVGIGTARMSMEAMGSLAAGGKLPARQAFALIDVLRSGEVPSVVEALEYERFCQLDMMIWFARKPGGARFEDLVKTLHVQLGGEPGKQPPPGTEKAKPKTRAIDPVFRRADYDKVLRRVNAVFDEMVKIAELPTFAQRVNAADALGDKLNAIKAAAATDLLTGKPTSPPPTPAQATELTANLLVGTFTPTLGRAITLRDEIAVTRTLTAVALALAAFRADTGSYPPNLDALAPKYLKRVPLDFCSGRPFIYRPGKAGFLIYSVGLNMRDDGGRSRDEAKDDYDIVVRSPGAAAAGK